MHVSSHAYLFNTRNRVMTILMRLVVATAPHGPVSQTGHLASPDDFTRPVVIAVLALGLSPDDPPIPVIIAVMAPEKINA